MLTCLCSWLNVSMNFCELPAMTSFPFISFAGTGTDKISGIIHGFNHPTENQCDENFFFQFIFSTRCNRKTTLIKISECRKSDKRVTKYISLPKFSSLPVANTLVTQ